MMSVVDVLTYASFTVPGSRGGWSVGQRGGGLTDDEVRKLTEQVPTRIDATAPVPQYPSADDISRLQRRMAWTRAPWQGDDRVFWFSSPAGEDATGRAGNVFTQVHVFRGGAGESPALWPSDLMFSPALRFPFGSREVNSTTVPEGAPPPGPLANPGQLWPWIFADCEVDRRAVLGAILDGCADGRLVAVACPPEDAAMWVAAACQAQSPATARDFSWSTFERARSLGTARARGMSLACIPVEDAAEAAELSDVIVIKTDETPVTGVYGSEPTKVGGSSVPVSEWSALLAFMFLTPDEAIHFSAAVRAGEVPAAVGGDPAWQLAAAASTNPELRSAAREPLTGLLSRPGDAPENLGALFPGGTVGVLADEFIAGDGGGPAPLPALATLAAAGLFDDADRQEESFASLEQRGLGGAIVRGDAGVVSTPIGSDNPLVSVLRQITATDPALHAAIADGIGLPVAAAEWLGVPQMAERFLDTMRGTAPDEFKAPVWEGDLIGAWVLGAMSDLGGPSGGVSADAPGADDWSAADWAAPSPGPSPEMKAFGLNSLVESLGGRVTALPQVVERELTRMPDPERRLLAEGPWLPQLEKAAAERRARKEAEEAEARERARRRREEEEAKARVLRREEERRRAEQASARAAQRPRMHELTPAYVRYVDPRQIAEIENHAGPELGTAIKPIFGLGPGMQAWVILGEIMLTAQRDDLPDMDRIRRVVLASALAESLLDKWYLDTRFLPWWMLDDMRDDELRDLLEMTIEFVRRSEPFRGGSVDKLGGDNPPPEARGLTEEARAMLGGDLAARHTAQGRTPRDIPSAGGSDGGRRHRDGGAGSSNLFGKRRRRSDDHK